jgi:prepilin-type N-terminal cleavage/methylation domain-containing protein
MLRMRARGFTLVELLIVVSMIGIILGLSMTGLGHARYAARTAVDLANLRSHVQAFAAYQANWDGQFPAYTRPDADVTIIRPVWDFGPIDITGYFGGRNMWTLALADTLFDGKWDSRSFLSAHNPVDYEFTDFYFDQSYLADPKYWRRETRTGMGQWRSTRAHEVVHPGAKSIFVNTYRDIAEEFSVDASRRHWDIGFVDGSARSFPDERVHGGYPSGGCCDECGVDRRSSGCGISRPPATCTIDGVRGMDVRP